MSICLTKAFFVFWSIAASEDDTIGITLLINILPLASPRISLKPLSPIFSLIFALFGASLFLLYSENILTAAVYSDKNLVPLLLSYSFNISPNNFCETNDPPLDPPPRYLKSTFHPPPPLPDGSCLIWIFPFIFSLQKELCLLFVRMIFD